MKLDLFNVIDKFRVRYRRLRIFAAENMKFIILILLVHVVICDCFSVRNVHFTKEINLNELNISGAEISQLQI